MNWALLTVLTFFCVPMLAPADAVGGGIIANSPQCREISNGGTASCEFSCGANAAFNVGGWTEHTSSDIEVHGNCGGGGAGCTGTFACTSTNWQESTQSSTGPCVATTSWWNFGIVEVGCSSDGPCCDADLPTFSSVVFRLLPESIEAKWTTVANDGTVMTLQQNFPRSNPHPMGALP